MPREDSMGLDLSSCTNFEWRAKSPHWGPSLGRSWRPVQKPLWPQGEDRGGQQHALSRALAGIEITRSCLQSARSFRNRFFFFKSSCTKKSNEYFTAFEGLTQKMLGKSGSMLLTQRIRLVHAMSPEGMKLERSLLGPLHAYVQCTFGLKTDWPRLWRCPSALCLLPLNVAREENLPRSACGSQNSDYEKD